MISHSPSIIPALALSAIASCVLVSIAPAQEPSKGADVTVVILDVAKVFEESSEFNRQLDLLKKEAKKAEIELDGSSSPTERKQDSVSSEDLKDKLLERQADIYSQTYDEMLSIVKEMAETYELRLVIKTGGDVGASGTNKGSSKHASILERINQPVVFHEKLDLTRMVIQRMNEKTGLHAARCEHCGQNVSSQKADVHSEE